MSKKRGQQHKKSYVRSRRGTPSAQPIRTQPRRTVKLVARSWETMALDVPLRFAVPPSAASIDGAETYWWRLIEYGTEITDPAAFPPFEQPLGPAVLRACDRYMETARDLAGSAALNYPISLEVKLHDENGGEDVSFDPPPPDATAGFAVLLRHFYSHNEKASFEKLVKLLRTHAANEDGQGKDDRFAQLDAWKGVEGRTRQRSVQNQAIKQLIADGRAPNDPDLETYPDVAPPEQVISDYFYGDHLQWDSKAAVVDARGEDPFLDAIYRQGFFVAAAGLAHLYIGFAALVEKAVAKQRTADTPSTRRA